MKFIKHIFFLSFVLISCINSAEPTIDKVVIWGITKGTHTHHFIHFAFHRAFEHMGYPTHWIEDGENPKDFDYKNTLFIALGGYDQTIPVRDDCYYVIHNPSSDKYNHLRSLKRCLILQVTTDSTRNLADCREIVSTCYYHPSGGVYMPWATDLLPHEIDAQKQFVLSYKNSKEVNWVGTVWDGKFGNIKELTAFKKACSRERVRFQQKQSPTTTLQDNINLIHRSLLAPTIVGTWQNEVGYIPCRIFKNISYGHIGMTNSKSVWEVFNRKILYEPDCNKLFHKGVALLKTITKEEIYEQMDFVRDNHTYVNRIQFLLHCFELHQN